MNTVKLQQVLARAGVASRRRAEDLIRVGRVKVNGETATIGMRVDPTEDVISVDRKQIKPVAPVWIALHKPVGYLVTKKDPRGRQTVFDLVPPIPGLIYVGRLDVLTSGLLLLTTDGQNAHRLTHPRFGVEREYRVRVRGRETSEIRQALERPIVIEERSVAIVRSRVRSLGRDLSEITLVLAEGRHRIVRRLCDCIGVSVDRLTRISHGPIALGGLPEGKWRYLTEHELRVLRGPRAA